MLAHEMELLITIIGKLYVNPRAVTSNVLDLGLILLFKDLCTNVDRYMSYDI